MARGESGLVGSIISWAIAVFVAVLVVVLVFAAVVVVAMGIVAVSEQIVMILMLPAGVVRMWCSNGNDISYRTQHSSVRCFVCAKW